MVSWRYVKVASSILAGGTNFLAFLLYFSGDLVCENGERAIEFDVIMFVSPKIVKSLLFFWSSIARIKRRTYVHPGHGMLFTPITNVRAYNIFGISKTE
ncbi:hypothetical protein V8C43DRAFT_272447 [Trichoderma afarasin]